jgi:hypothetical protein
VSSTFTIDETASTGRLVFLVRPAWALSCGCKSRRKETILIEAKPQLQKGDRLWGGSGERNRESMYKNQIRGDVERGEQAKGCEAPMVKAQAA